MPAHLKDYEKAVDLYNSGKSVFDTAIEFDVAQSTMYQILKRRGVKFRRPGRYSSKES